MKHEAKTLVDTVFVRLGDVLAALTLFVGTHFLQVPVRSLYMVNVFLGLLWLAGAAMLAREHHRMVAGKAESLAAAAS
jgi:AAA family ATP:ADP antiporter